MANASQGQWEKVAAAVAADATALAAMDTPGQLFAWAKEHKLNTKQLFPKFKTELRKQTGVDYEQVREKALRERHSRLLEASAGRVELFAAGDGESDPDGERGSYAVCDGDGAVLWHGGFYDDDRDFVPGDQLSADTAAAAKAIFLAGKARQAAELESVTLVLTVSNPHLDADDLVSRGVRAGVVVQLEVSDELNPATEWCQNPGFRSWREVVLTSLVASPDVVQS